MANNKAFFENLQDFLQTNRRDIIDTLRDHEETAHILLELNKLEGYSDKATKIVGRMKNMLMGSQQIYSENKANRQTA